LTALALAPTKVNTSLQDKPPKRNALNRLRGKSVKKTEAVGVKKISLFDDQREEFGPDSYREAKLIRFLAFSPSAAALFGYFFQLQGKSNSPSGWRTW